MNWTPYLETLKEVLRIAVLAAVSAVVTYLIGFVTIVPQTETTALVLVVLRLADNLLHELGKSWSTRKGESWALRGLTRF